ncbi:MAG: FkbM family methyltransferase [Verrucomicrobiae bacterium]|nr:FkbM family methyltransferase [Verrucomicrobiae bacterium]
MKMQSDLIYDVGMHNGDDTAYYLHKGYRVLAIEANPMLVDKVKTRFKNALQDKRLKILNVGISERKGISTFWVCREKTEWSSFEKKLASRNGYDPIPKEVECVTFSDILEQHGTPYYAKIDIEGSDDISLVDLNRSIAPPYISLEFSDICQICRLNTLGYKGFKLIDQLNFRTFNNRKMSSCGRYYLMKGFYERASWNRAAVCTRIAAKLVGKQRLEKAMQKHRIHEGWVFPNGSSGPMADETSGHWSSWIDASLTVLQFYKRQQAISRPAYRGWWDIHACKEVP